MEYLVFPPTQKPHRHLRVAIFFSTVKNCFISSLKRSDFNLPFILHGDTSDMIRGVVLMQKINDDRHPILYLSRKYLPRGKDYCQPYKVGQTNKPIPLGLIVFYLKKRSQQKTPPHFIFMWIQKRPVWGIFSNYRETYASGSFIVYL